MKERFQIDEEKMKQFVEEWVHEEEEKYQKSCRFALTRENEVMEKLCQIIEEKKVLDMDHFAYQKDVDFGMTSEEFYFLFDHLRQFAVATRKADYEDEHRFGSMELFVTYKEFQIVFRIAHGQGTAIFAFSPQEEEWNEVLSFAYEDYRKQLDENGVLKAIWVAGSKFFLSEKGEEEGIECQIVYIPALDKYSYLQTQTFVVADAGNETAEGIIRELEANYDVRQEF